MAKDYTSAIERARKLREERAGESPAPSLMLPGTAQSETKFESTKDYSAAIERMRANQIKRKESERPLAQLDTLRNRFQNNPSRLPAKSEKVEVEFEDGSTKKLNSDLIADSVIGRGINTYSWNGEGPVIYESQEELQSEIDKIKNVDKPAAGEKYENALKLYSPNSDEVKSAYEEFESWDTKIQELEEKIKLRQEYDKYVEYQEKYASLVNNADFKENSQYETLVPEGKSVRSLSGHWDDLVYEAINGNEEAKSIASSDRRTINKYGWLKNYDLKELEMDPEEIAIYNYIFKTQGREAATEFVDLLANQLTKRQREKAETEAAAYAEEHPVLSSVETVLTSPMKLFAYMGQGFDLIDDGEIDPNALYNQASYRPTAIRETVSKTVEENWGGVGTFMYGVGMSMGDFLMASAMTGGTGWATAILGAGAAADTTLDALDRGLSSEDAFILGTAAGAIEAVTEKLSIDKLVNIPSKNKLVKYIIENTLSEGAEEAISEVANTIADIIISGDRAELVVRVNEYKMAGLSESEAITKALLDKLKETGLAALGGAISGATMSGGRVAIKYAGSAVQNAGNQAAILSNKYQGQEAIRNANLSEELKTQKAEQQQDKIVLPTLEDIERQKARERGEVFDIGYEKPYSKYADSDEDIELKKRIDAAESITEKTGLRHGASKQMIADALELGRAIGREVEFFTQKSADGKTVKDGFYNPQNGHIYVNVNAAKSLETTISHEFTHSLEKTTSYQALENLARDTMARNGEDFDLAIEATKKLYEKAGVDYAADDASIKSDVIADFVEKYVLGNKKSILEIAKARPSFARKVKMWLTNLLSKLAPKSSGNVYATVKQIEDMYDDAVPSAADKAVTAEGVVKDAFKGEKIEPRKHISIDASLNDYVDEITRLAMSGEITEAEFDDLYAKYESVIEENKRITDEFVKELKDMEKKLMRGEISSDEFDSWYDSKSKTADRVSAELGVKAESVAVGDNTNAEEEPRETKRATEPSRASERAADEAEKPKKKAPAKTETKTATTDNADTDTTYLEEAEEFMRQAEEDLAEGRITEEEFAERERYYNEIYASGGNIERSSEGFSTEGFFPKLVRKGGEKLGLWSVSETLDADLDAVLNHTFDSKNNEVYIGETSNFLTDVIGVKSMPVYMPASKAYSAMATKSEWENTRFYKKQDNYHGLGKEKLIEILNASENPIAAFVATPDMDGNERNNRIVLVTDVKINGQNAVVIEEVETTALKNSNRVKANKIISTYDKSMIADHIIDAYAEGRLLYFDKKRSQYLAGVRGSKPQAAIRDTDFTNNIAQFWYDVKNNSKDVTKVQHSVSETEAESTSEESTTDAYSELDSRAKRHLNGVEKTLGRAFANSLNVDIKNEDGKEDAEKLKKFIEEAVRPITNEYLLTGAVSAHTISNVFEEYYKNPMGIPSTWYDQAKMDARGMFERAINENWNVLRYIRNYSEESKREKAMEEAAEPIERKEARRRFDTLRKMQKLERRAMRNNLLTNADMLEVGKLLKGETSLKNINPVKHNVEGIRAVYEAKMQTKEAEAAVSEYRRQIKASIYETVDKYLETSLSWKDKANGIQYQRETLERNIMDIVPDRALAREIIREYVSPVHQHEADAIRWKKKLANRVRALDLSLKVSKDGSVSESYMVQFWGEANDHIKLLEASNDPDAKRDGHTLEEWRAMVDNMWAANPNVDQAKIKKAAEEFRKIYEEIFEEMNNVLLDNGYAPVPYRKGYFPHFTGEEETVLAKFGRLIGIKTEMVALPTTINGLTENFKPGKTWFGHGQQRKGFYTTYDAVTGFEQYIKGAADVIFHTEDIQKLRALAKRIRYNASDEAIKLEAEKIEANPTLDDAQKESLLSELRAEGKYALSNFVAYLDEYTNKLANKKSRVDRDIESLFGRSIYVTMSNLESRIAANMIVGNFGSALTNFIPINQAGAQLGWDWILKGMQSSYKNVLNGDSFSESSTFLMNRRGYDPLVQTWVDKASNVGGKVMEIIDNFASETIVRAAYAKNLAAGLTADEALYQADLFAASVMADRSKGAMPLIFENKNPLIKLFTQFQLEVNNEFSVLFKDIPRMERKRWQDHIAYVLFKYFLGAWLYNELYEFIVGRRAALDPIGTVVDAVEEGTENGWGAGVESAVTDIGSQLPFVGGVLGGGRIPIQSALPDIPNLIRAITDTEWHENKKFHERWQEISKPLAYAALPLGGGLLKKLYSGTMAIAAGGKYTIDADGNRILQYPFYNDQGFLTFVEGARALAFGTTSTSAGQEWVESGFGSLGAKQTAVYESLIESGVGEKTAYDFIKELSSAEADIADTKTETIEFAGIKVDMEVPIADAPNVMSKSEVQRQMIRESDLDGEGRAIVYFGLLASENEQELMVNLDILDADMGVVTEVLMGMKDAAGTSEKIDLLINADLEDDEKRLIYYDRISESRGEAVVAFYDAGMNFDTYLSANKVYNELYNGEGTASYKATQLARWINQNGFSEDEKAVIEEQFKYYSMIPAGGGTYDKFIDAGLDDEVAYKLSSAIADLEPLEGETKVSNLQKYRAVIDSVGSPVYQMEALSTVMSESVYKKTSTAYSYKIEPETYVTYLEKLQGYDKDGSGSLSQAEVETALRELSGNLTFAERMTIELTGGEAPGLLYVSDDQLAVLWQLSGNWSPKNNPYSPEIGAKVKEMLGQ